jgi:hypothetical protein
VTKRRRGGVGGLLFQCEPMVFQCKDLEVVSVVTLVVFVRSFDIAQVGVWKHCRLVHMKLCNDRTQSYGVRNPLQDPALLVQANHRISPQSQLPLSALGLVLHDPTIDTQAERQGERGDGRGIKK